MNIKQAKEQIRNTLRAYLTRDALGAYRIPPVRQRPVLLMGPPGIGKTQIMEQIASEENVGLVSYTITHHTRQSAVGLPFIEKRVYDGVERSVTEYTMSEIIGSVYALMEKTGIREGILFLDEINCVSETLAPAMLQFLQQKMFGPFRIPEGWIIVTAGNPRSFNRSAREYDVAVLDRLRKLNIEPDLDAWMAFAMKESVHGAILSYLTFHRDHFFLVRGEEGTAEYVTARGWQDLSTLLQACERLQIEVDEELVFPYLTVRSIAKTFSAFYRLYRKCFCDSRSAQMPQTFSGWISSLSALAVRADRQEQHILAGLLLDTLGTELAQYRKQENLAALAGDRLKKLKSGIHAPDAASRTEQQLRKWEEALVIRKQYFLVSAADADTEEQLLQELRLCLQHIREEHLSTDAAGIAAYLQDRQTSRIADLKTRCSHLQQQLEESLLFIKEYLPEETQQAFLMQLTANENAVRFISAHGCEAYFSLSEKGVKRDGSL